MSLTLEMRGIAPRTSDLISGRSPFDLHPMSIKSRGIFFRLVSNYEFFFFRSEKIYLLGISICNRLSGDSY